MALIKAEVNEYGRIKVWADLEAIQSLALPPDTNSLGYNLVSGDSITYDTYIVGLPPWVEIALASGQMQLRSMPLPVKKKTWLQRWFGL